MAGNFEKAGRGIGCEVVKRLELLDCKVKPATREEIAALSRKASERPLKLGESLE